jgi:glycerophosphoryl diester phosphodiesterase
VRDVITRLTTEEDLGEDSLTKSTLDKLDIKKATLKLQQRMQCYKGMWLDTQYDFPIYLDLIINDTFYKNGRIVHDSEALLNYITEEKTDSILLYYNIFNDENGLIKYDESYLELLERRYEYYSSQEGD